MLSDGFALELNEIIKSCPVSRQTMLFSATMTDSVDQLIRMSLKKPVRLFVDPKRRIAPTLVQEFVRVRAGKEPERSAMLVALCKRTFKSGVIVFFRSKKLAHQMKILFGLLNMDSEELHGNLSQEQVSSIPCSCSSFLTQIARDCNHLKSSSMAAWISY
jgi:ATP-dependent RNA helicase DDX27